MVSSTAESGSSRMKVCSWLMDLGSPLSPISSSNQPPASRPRALPARASPHLPKRSSSVRSRAAPGRRPVRDAQRVRFCSITLPTPGIAHLQRRQKGGLRARQHPEHAVGLGLIAGHLGHQPRGGDADGAVQAASRAFMASCRRARRAAAARSRRSVPVISR